MRNANATDAARILNEWFNPGAAQAQAGAGGGGGRWRTRGGGGLGALLGGGLGGLLGGGGEEATPASKQKVRIVADPTSNSLLVKASPLDVLTIYSILDQSIDSGETDSKAIARTYVIGPLKQASAFEVGNTIREVFRENVSGGGGNTGGGNVAFNPFNPFQRGGQQQPAGNPKNAAPSLSVSVNDQTNTVIVNCPPSLYEEIKKLVDQIEGEAKDATRVVKVYSVKGVDPELLRQGGRCDPGAHLNGDDRPDLGPNRQQ